jgi:AcrR family transcriptional regulator
MNKPKGSSKKGKEVSIDDRSTEEKIKQAARAVFTRKGYAATRTRDIAEEAGINLALLNYYFRSKEKLFDLIMFENMQHFLVGMKGILNDSSASLDDKITRFVSNYIDLLKSQPDLPLFVLHELKSNPEKLIQNMGMQKVLMESHFFKQLMEATKGKIHPLHLVMNIVSMTVFPFIASPILKGLGNLKHKDFEALMEERKKMIPVWIQAILKTK